MKPQAINELLAMIPADVRPVFEVMVRMYEARLKEGDDLIKDLQERIRVLEARLNEHVVTLIYITYLHTS